MLISVPPSDRFALAVYDVSQVVALPQPKGCPPEHVEEKTRNTMFGSVLESEILGW